MTATTAVAPTNAAAAAAASGSKGASGNNSSGSPSGAGSTSSSGAGALSINNGLASLAGNFQSFLTLLTTQLQNQDPLNPTDTNQFTQQITQMTGVEQQLISNQLLQQLVSAQGGGISTAASLIGDTVTAPGASASTPVTGVVTGVTESGGQTLLTLSSSQTPIPLSSVTGVSTTKTSSTH
jgi:flagellar basal-body rod modification protein FlgD